ELRGPRLGLGDRRDRGPDDVADALRWPEKAETASAPRQDHPHRPARRGNDRRDGAERAARAAPGRGDRRAALRRRPGRAANRRPDRTRPAAQTAEGGERARRNPLSMLGERPTADRRQDSKPPGLITTVLHMNQTRPTAARLLRRALRRGLPPEDWLLHHVVCRIPLVASRMSWYARFGVSFEDHRSGV